MSRRLRNCVDVTNVLLGCSVHFIVPLPVEVSLDDAHLDGAGCGVRVVHETLGTLWVALFSMSFAADEHVCAAMCAAASTLWSMPPCEALAPFVGLVPVLWQSRWYWGFAYRDEGRSSVPASACTEVLRKLDMKQRLSIVCDLAKGVAHLHAAGVMHGNLAPDNMLVVHTAERPSALALVLYGVDGIRHNISFLSGGKWYPRYDPVWRPPDRSTGLATTAGDIFCMGAVAWLVLLGTTQLPLQDDHTGIWGSRNDCVNDAPQLVPGVPERMARVLRQCTSAEPAMRPSARLVQLELQPDTTSEAHANSSPPTVTPRDVAVRYTTSPEASRGVDCDVRMSLFLQAVGHEQVEPKMAAAGATLEVLETLATDQGAMALRSFLHDTCEIDQAGVILHIIAGLVTSGIQLKPSSRK